MAGETVDPVAHGGSQDDTPVASKGFGPREDADETRQAQHQMANDEPTDVNFNAIVARSQALTVDVAGKEFAANSDFRDKVQARYLAKVG